MEAAYQSLIQHMDAHETKYEADVDVQLVGAVFGAPNGLFLVHARITEEDAMLQVFGHVPIKVPVGSRPSIAEAITRANYGLKLGRFEMDYSDGELRFYVAHLLNDGQLADEVIERLMRTTLGMLDHYSPAFMLVIYGNELPGNAIRREEQGE
jgi:hypothetical protein